MQWPDHIKNSIFQYIWKLKIKDVNRQYSDNFRDDTKYDYPNFGHDKYNGSYYKIVHTKDYRRINWRSYNYVMYLNFEQKIQTGHICLLKIVGNGWKIVPLKYYWFSSGINNPNGYK
jgi:hypothetical protein